jgi:hypothetical protein
MRANSHANELELVTTLTTLECNEDKIHNKCIFTYNINPINLTTKHTHKLPYHPNQ